MYRITQYRPSKKDRYSKVKVSRFSEKTNEQGVQYTLENIAYRGKITDEEITELKNQNQDLNSSLLPKTRRAILSELFKYHKSLLFNMGLILLLFSLPLIGVNLWFNIIIEKIYYYS